jgi:hypothetical protein
MPAASGEGDDFLEGRRHVEPRDLYFLGGFREFQDPADAVGSLHRRPFDLLEVFQGFGAIFVEHQELGPVQDDAQDVVEIVLDAAAEAVQQASRISRTQRAAVTAETSVGSRPGDSSTTSALTTRHPFKR